MVVDREKDEIALSDDVADVRLVAIIGESGGYARRYFGEGRGVVSVSVSRLRWSDLRPCAGLPEMWQTQ